MVEFRGWDGIPYSKLLRDDLIVNERKERSGIARQNILGIPAVHTKNACLAKLAKSIENQKAPPKDRKRNSSESR